MRERNMARKETPLMQQYNRVKTQHPDAILLFRVGDFYETFGEDAVRAAKVLDIVLTKRGNGSASEIELAGFPHHSLNTYLPKLVRAGNRVAVCDQLEDPKLAKGLVKRGITELVTPGVALHDDVLEAKANNYVAALHWTRKGLGVAFLDISTGDFQASEGDVQFIDKLLQSFQPSELLYQRGNEGNLDMLITTRCHRTRLEDWVFSEAQAEERLQSQFGSKSGKGFGLGDSPLAVVAAGAILNYLEQTKHDRTEHIRSLKRITSSGMLWMDPFTIRNLELLTPSHPDGTALIDVLDGTVSPMGARAIRRWMMIPLTAEARITERHEAVSLLLDSPEIREELQGVLKGVGDLERLTAKASTSRINPRELGQLYRGIEGAHHIAGIAEGELALMPWLESMDPCDDLRSLLAKSLEEEPPAALGKGKVIRPGVDAKLDELRSLQANAQDALEEICRREAKLTGISSLKISFNNVFGYYLEVRHAHKDKVPANWTRKQTLTQAERYITEELKELEQRILEASERADAIEARCFHELVLAASRQVDILLKNAQAIASVDVLVGLAYKADQYAYSRPIFRSSHGVEIRDGRHPVIEHSLPLGEAYIANDVTLDPKEQQILMVTGPNMSGKSALLRQTALICLMAQMGSFVPAREAHLGILDRIFTRVGASDNISSGESTFMVEMTETASILNNLTDRSLVLLDEIGRGTSTYDGVSIAWAIAEYLHSHPKYRPLTLFATHYHELNDMQSAFPRIRNFNVSVHEKGGKVVFLRKLVPGGCNHSFGIHVARIAGMPGQVVSRAQAVLSGLEQRSSRPAEIASESPNDEMQLSIFQLDDPTLSQVRDQLLNIDTDHLTPVEALMKLNEIQKAVSG
jgi:DNA mismatch repair protein MutS